jgi:catechol 2,3-dioxygenase-like lactoylglutathione lyase family enzyme
MMILGIHHVTFLSSDLARSRDFYEGVLGLRPSPDRPQMGFDGAWYDIEANQQIHLMLLPNPEAGLQRPQHGGRDRHVALGVDDLDALRAKLDEAGIAYTVSKSGRAALFCRDPDGNALEFLAG